MPRMNGWRSRRAYLPRGLFLILLLYIPLGWCDTEYRVEIDVPRAYKALLWDNLDIVKQRGRAQVDVDYLRRLHAKTTQQIAELLATEGYYSARVHADLIDEGGAWLARYRVDLGAAVTVKDFAFEFQGVVSGEEFAAYRARLRERWRLPPGRVFRQAEWEAAKRDLLRALLIEQFPAARLIDSSARVDVAQGQASLHVIIDSGPAFRYGELQISGLRRYPANLVRELSAITLGAPYNQTELLQLQTRLHDSGYFKSVEVRVDPHTPQPQEAPVLIELTENPSKAMGFGIGYSTDSGARGRVEYSDSNVRGRGWRWRSGLDIDRIKQGISSGIDLPINREGERDSVNTSYVHQDAEGETIDTTRVAVSRAEPVAKFERVTTLQYQHEVQEVAGSIGDIRQALTGNVSWSRRRADDLLYPTRGYSLTMQIGGAHEALFSDRSFARAYIKGARFYPLGQRHTLMWRAELGFVEAESRVGIPSDFLFRTGGDQSVRGYPVYSLGVREGSAVVPGRALAVGSLEYNYWLSRPWGAALFYDLGDAADNAGDFAAVAGYGVGARWRSPVGPINLDVAYGEALQRYRVHFAMGVVF